MGIAATTPAPAADVNGFYVTKKTASKYKLKTMSDLAKVAPKLTFGGPPECQDRDLCLGAKSQQIYGLQFKEVKKLDTGGPVTVKALEDGDIQVGELFTGSSVISKDAVLLKDDKGLQGADNTVVLVKQDKNTKGVVDILESVNSKLDTAAYNEIALKVFNDKIRPRDRGSRLAAEVGLT
jgi:osmoprotectant transport system substrate-binding protein